MIRFHNNYHFCYIAEKSKVYTIGKSSINSGLVTTKVPHRSLNQMLSTTQFYTVPFVSRVEHEAVNVLYGFISKDACMEYISENMFLDTENIPFMFECDLADMKSVSKVLKMPLIIEVSKLMPNDHYELYFYRDALKGNNIKDI